MIRYTYYIFLYIFLGSCQDFSSVDKQQGQNIQLTATKHHASTEKEIDQLFVQLKVADNERVIRRTQQRIRELWSQHPDTAIDTLMKMGVQAMYSKDYQRAIENFSRVIQLKPDFAEGWNKRATVFFMKGNFQASLEDIRETLRLEQRHFGALAGMASIHMMRGQTEKALQTYERLHHLVPKLTEVNRSIRELRTSLGYRSI